MIEHGAPVRVAATLRRGQFQPWHARRLVESVARKAPGVLSKWNQEGLRANLIIEAQDDWHIRG